MRFCVNVISPPDYRHSAAFAEVAETIFFGLIDLGHDAIIRVNGADADRVHIVLGPQLLPYVDLSLPGDAILYNLEQIEDGSDWMRPEMVCVLKRGARLWDYSARNATRLLELRIGAATVVPLGYTPELTRIEHVEHPDIDVLLFGSMNGRRRQVLTAMRALGLNAVGVFGIYGEPRDALIARAKIVLNVHFYESKVLEMARISYLLANRCTVLSEHSANRGDDDSVAGGVAFANYHDLPQRACDLLESRGHREALAERGLDIMRARPITGILQPIIGRVAQAA
jgi:hypothetical protein